MYTFSKLFHSKWCSRNASMCYLRFEPMTLTVLTQCSTNWATGTILRNINIVLPLKNCEGKQWDNEGAESVVCARVESTQLEDVITTRPLSVLQWSAGSQRAELEEVLGYSPSLSHAAWKCGGLGTAATSGARMHAHTKVSASRCNHTLLVSIQICAPCFSKFGRGWWSMMQRIKGIVHPNIKPFIQNLYKNLSSLEN